MGASAFSS